MILNKDEFVELYHTIRREHPEKSLSSCYEFAETLHVTFFGERKYSDYNSFRQVL
jgi:hypothetical protein